MANTISEKQMHISVQKLNSASLFYVPKSEYSSSKENYSN